MHLPRALIFAGCPPGPYSGSGNRCGHSPKNPKLLLPSPSKTGVGGLPRLITLAQERIEQLYQNPLIFPILHKNPDRKTRTERLEACVLVIKALLKRMDLSTLCCGRPTLDNGFIDIDMRTIVAETGIGQRRCERAIRQFRTAGLVTVAQPRGINQHGKYFGCRAIRAISKDLFTWLGLDKILQEERRKATERLRKFALVNNKRYQDLIKRVLPSKAQARGFTFTSSKNQEEVNRLWNMRVAEIMRQSPNSPPEEWALKTNRELNLPLDYSPGRRV